MKVSTCATMAAMVAVLAAGAASAANLVQNGTFVTTSAINTQFGPQYGGDVVPGWTGNYDTSYYAGYHALEAVFHDGTATTVSAASIYNDPRYILWGTTGAADNTFTGFAPVASNIIVLDGDAQFTGGLSQMINGLTAGKDYTVRFYWAAGELQNSNGDTTNRLAVALGGGDGLTQLEPYLHSSGGEPGHEGQLLPSVTDAATCLTATLCLTPQVSVPARDFTGWFQDSITFKASGSSELLSFLASGTPYGTPPTALLADVSLNAAVPEPATWALMIVGLGLAGATLRARRREALLAA